MIRDRVAFGYWLLANYHFNKKNPVFFINF